MESISCQKNSKRIRKPQNPAAARMMTQPNHAALIKTRNLKNVVRMGGKVPFFFYSTHQQLVEIPEKERNVLEAFGILFRRTPKTPLNNGITIENGHVRKIFLTFPAQEKFNVLNPNKKIGDHIYYWKKHNHSKEFKGIPENIGDLEYLEHIKFEFDIFNTFPESIGNLKNLKTLNLSICNITKLPESFGNLKNLTVLNIGANQLSAIPEWINYLKNLTNLIMTSNRLTTIPRTIGDLKNLKILHLNHCNLTKLPESIGNLKNLTELNFSSNNLSALPISFGNLRNLIIFRLNHCNFKSIPPPIRFLTNLRILEFTKNQISSIPEWIGDLTSLSTLKLGWNNLSTLPDTFEKLINLSNLCIWHNNFPELPKVLNRFNYINQITLIPNPFKSLETLRYFFLHHDYRNILDIDDLLRSDRLVPATVKQLILDNNQEGLFNYYNPPLMEIIKKCTCDFNSLSDHEIERLIWESSSLERKILELHLPSDNPILEKINERLKFHLKNGIKLFK